MCCCDVWVDREHAIALSRPRKRVCIVWRNVVLRFLRRRVPTAPHDPPVFSRGFFSCSQLDSSSLFPDFGRGHPSCHRVSYPPVPLPLQPPTARPPPLPLSGLNCCNLWPMLLDLTVELSHGDLYGLLILHGIGDGTWPWVFIDFQRSRRG